MTKFEENPVTAQEAAEIMGVSASTISALKRSMGITSRRVFVSELRKYLRENPQWNTTLIYHRKTCKCRECLRKRAAKLLAKPNLTVPASQTSGQLIAPGLPKAEMPISARTEHGVSFKTTGSLGAKLRFLRGKRQATEVASKTGLSRESVYRIERGDPVKIATVKKLAAALNATPIERLDLLIAWINQTLAEDAGHVSIEALSAEKPTYYPEFERQANDVKGLLERLNETQRDHLVTALQNREILNCMSTMVRLAQKEQR